MAGSWILWIIFGILVLLAIIAIIAVKKGKKKPTDYYSLFMMGAIWVPFGVVMMFMEPDFSLGTFFFIIGWVYFVMGIMHKEKWEKNRKANVVKRTWLRWLIGGILGFLAAVGLALYLGFR